MFKLLRYFSVTSLLAFTIVIVLLAVFYQRTATRDLTELEENANVALTQMFANTLWPRFAPFVTTASSLSVEELRSHPVIQELHQAVLEQMNGLPVVKVKVYNLNALTVFSTDASQIGDDKSTNAGYLSARSGQVASELTHRDTFSAFESVIENRDVFSSYIPIRPGVGQQIEGVFELYTDVTPLLNRIRLTQRIIIFRVTLILLGLYAVLFLVVGHADRIIRRHHNEREQVEKKLQHDALHDGLTGLANRSLLGSRLDHAHKYSARNQDYGFAVMFIDLDRFKIINDSLGHDVGDQLLITVAERLRECLRASDTVARLDDKHVISRFGGDEFAVFLDDVRTPEEAAVVAERVQTSLSAPIMLNDHEVATSASIGIALSSTVVDDFEDLLKAADTAMYRAKENGKAQYAIFDADMGQEADTRLHLENDLRMAIEREEFHLAYQPIVSLDRGEIKGIEALLRWHHPQHGLISPEEFIPIAEESRLIVPIGTWVLWEGCRQVSFWKTLFPDVDLELSINVSGQQLSQPNFARVVENVLNETGVKGSALKLEITEGGLVQEGKSTRRTLHELKELGVSLAIDDFGMGYSSLSYVHRFPIDTIKIDRSFIARIGTDQEGAEIVRTITNLGKNLGLKVIAEGIETPEQRDLLRNLGCETGQGWLYSKAVAGNAIEEMLRTVSAKHLYNGDTVVNDNQIDADENDEPTTELGGESFVIQK